MATEEEHVVTIDGLMTYCQLSQEASEDMVGTSAALMILMAAAVIQDPKWGLLVLQAVEGKMSTEAIAALYAMVRVTKSKDDDVG